MGKTNKELAVELLSSYLDGWYSGHEKPKAIDEETLAKLLEMFYKSVCALPDS